MKWRCRPEARLRVRAGHRPLHRIAGAVTDGDAFAGQHRPVAVLEIADLIGEGRERQRIWPTNISPLP